MSGLHTASAWLVALLALGPVASPAGARWEKVPPAAARRFELPAPLVAGAATVEGGRRGLALLLAAAPPAGGGAPARQLLFLDPATGRLETLIGQLPPAAGELLASGGRLWLPVERFGSLEVLTPDGAGGAATVASYALPRRAERTRWGLRLSSPPVLPVTGSADAAGGAPCFATEPEAIGPRRLRVRRLCPSSAEAGQSGANAPLAGAPVESFALLPGTETVTAARFARLDGETVLAALTREKLGLFVKQRLRLFRLEATRNRMGTGPVLAADTDCPIWHPLELSFPDADGDGRRDLALVCDKGLIHEQLQIALYRGLGGARFEPRPRVVEIGGAYDMWSYDGDLDGDGRLDLLARSEQAIFELRSGGAGRRRPVAADPAWRFTLPPALLVDPLHLDPKRYHEPPRILGLWDLDGDGRAEVVIYRPRDDPAAPDTLLVIPGPGVGEPLVPPARAPLKRGH